jgi:hypothetical protein
MSLSLLKVFKKKNETKSFQLTRRRCVFTFATRHAAPKPTQRGWGKVPRRAHRYQPQSRALRQINNANFEPLLRPRSCPPPLMMGERRTYMIGRSRTCEIPPTFSKPQPTHPPTHPPSLRVGDAEHTGHRCPWDHISYAQTWTSNQSSFYGRRESR